MNVSSPIITSEFWKYFSIHDIQVFKGAMVRRTETEEESAEILCKFYQNISGKSHHEK